jgi:hypothetical protein
MVQRKFIIGECIAPRMACHFVRKNNPKSEILIHEHIVLTGQELAEGPLMQ